MELDLIHKGYIAGDAFMNKGLENLKSDKSFNGKNYEAPEWLMEGC